MRWRASWASRYCRARARSRTSWMRCCSSSRPPRRSSPGRRCASPAASRSLSYASANRKEQLVRDAVIVDAVRAPIGRRKGTLREVHPVDLSASVLTALAGRNQLDPELVEDVIFGCVTQIAEQSTNVGRLAVLAAGWPEAIPGVTLDR